MTFRFDSRHVLYGKLRPYLNKVALPDFEGRCTTEAIPLLPAPDVEREYLAWLLRRPETVEWAMREKTGSRMPRADMDHLLALSVALPPLSEQQRIVALLRQQMALVERARVAASEQHEHSERLAKITRDSIFARLREAGETAIPFGQLILETRNGVYKPNSFYGRGTPILKMFNIGRFDNTLSLENVDLIELTENEKRQWGLSEGDILVNRVNSKELVGKSALIPSKCQGYVYESKNLRLRVNRDRSYPAFVALWINSQDARRQIMSVSRQIVGQATINRSDLDALSIPLPSLSAQRDLVAEFEEKSKFVERIKASALSMEATLEQMPASLLKKAFTGRL